MKPANLKTKIFLDSGDPNETKETIKMLGFLDGQTTNPTLISKNPVARAKLDGGEKFTKEEIFGLYKEVVQEISSLIPQGSISIEVYADKNTASEQMLKQGREMFSWIPNAHIKFPTTKEGLKAAQKAIDEGMRVNMTLCFSQEQAAAVYAATSSSKLRHSGNQAIRRSLTEHPESLPHPNPLPKGEGRGEGGQARMTGFETISSFRNVFVSPFIGRLDDRGENGMDLIENIIKMYKKGDGHVEVLTASVRNLDHFLYAIKLGSDIITAPFKIIKEWAEKGIPIPDQNFKYDASNLEPIPYQEIDLNKPWQDYNIAHELTDVGIEKFSTDWNSLINPNF